MRERITLQVNPGDVVAPPAPHRTRQFVVRAPGHTEPLEAMLVEATEPSDQVLIYLVGFNNPLGPWEGLKAALMADAFGASVLAIELPGQSRFGGGIPTEVRRSMLRGQVQPWADLLMDYLEVALEDTALAPASLHLIGYSTGCSLGVAALDRLALLAPVASLTLVEPVATLHRSLPRLSIDNAWDVLRQPPSYRTNHHLDWVMAARRRQLREPWVRYSPADLLAITSVLRGDEIAHTLADAKVDEINLVGGTASTLCPPATIAALHELAGHGRTITVEGVGHPLWHSFPILVPLMPLLRPSSRRSV